MSEPQTTRQRASRREQRPAIRRAGLIGDVHTERVRLQAVLDFFAGQQLDHILCTGDLPDGPNDARDVDACCAALARVSSATIIGNHDRWLQDGEMRDLPDATDRDELAAETLSYLDSLPSTIEFDTPSGRALLCHGLGADDMAAVRPFDHGLALDQNEALQELLREGRYRYVLSGHTHRPMVREIAGLTIINAGTLLREHGPCCALVDFGARRITFYDVADDGAISQGSEWAL